MRVLLTPESKEILFNFLKEKYRVKNLIELAKKLQTPYKTVNHWRYVYKKYLPYELIKNCQIPLEILDKQPNNWGQIKGGKIGGRRNIKNLKKLWGEKKYYKIRHKIGKKIIKNLHKKYGIEKLTKMAVEGKLRKRENESKILKEENENYFINKEIFLDLKKIIYTPNDLKKKIIFPKKITEELAEEIGVHLGDGCLSKNKNYFSVKTNKKEEEYMINFLFPLYKKLYNLDLKLMRLPSVIGFEIYSRALFDFKNKVLEIPYGNKVEKIEVPKVITESKNKEIYRAFIRGLFDTDGCVNIIKSKKNYPVITFTIKSEKIILQTKEMLIKLGFIPYAGKWRIDINGNFMLNKWLKEIGSNNKKNLVKLKQASSSTRIE